MTLVVAALQLGLSVAVLGLLARQADGKLLLIGVRPVLGGKYSELLYRYDADGAIDATFGEGGIADATYGDSSWEPSALIVQRDGKIVTAAAQ